MPKKMRVYYDTEFLEDGKTIDLISIGMVREDGKTFYAVSNEANYLRIKNDDWLMTNVMSSIDHTLGGMYYPKLVLTDAAAMSREQIKQGVLDFTSDIWPEFWAWYGAYDHVALCQLFGKMIDLPRHFPMFTHDIRQYWDDQARPELPKQAEGKHNALEDALHNKVMFDYMKTGKGSVGPE